ncbi:hypothetical protein N7501_003599 [Penicillium viridicatum]|nr:hypothetical protein N7501_003599 [Penicillium viridicatum]
MTDDKISVIWPLGPEVDIFKGKWYTPLDLLTLWCWFKGFIILRFKPEASNNVVSSGVANWKRLEGPGVLN